MFLSQHLKMCARRFKNSVASYKTTLINSFTCYYTVCYWFSFPLLRPCIFRSQRSLLARTCVIFSLCHIIKHKVKPIEKCFHTSYFHRISTFTSNMLKTQEMFLWCRTFSDLDVFMCNEIRIIWIENGWMISIQCETPNSNKKKTKRETNYISYPIFTRSQAYGIHVTSAKTKE